MTILRKEKYLTSVLILSSVLLNSCGETAFVGVGDPNRGNSNSTDADQDFNNRRKFATEVLKNLFRLQKPTVGLAQIRNNEVPVISPIRVNNDDIFFQIYRCENNLTIDGVFESYDPENQSLAQPESARSYFERNQFWRDIEKRCKLVSIAQPQGEILDSIAPSGDWVWYLRACLAENSDKKFLCSNVITASHPLLGYRNQFSEYQQSLLTRIQSKLQNIRTISASFPERTRNLMNEIERCDQITWDKAKRSFFKSIALNIIGLGSSIIFEIFGPTDTQSKSWSEKIKVLWQPTDNVMGNGQAVTRILIWLFTNKHEFSETCATAEETRIATLTDLLQLKSMQVELSQDLDEAQKLDIPLPKEMR